MLLYDLQMTLTLPLVKLSAIIKKKMDIFTPTFDVKCACTWIYES